MRNPAAAMPRDHIAQACPGSSALRYTTGGSTAGASTTGTYVSTTAWNNYTNYLGGVHRWDSVTLNT